MTGIMWEDTSIENLSREELFEVIRHLMTEQKYWMDQTMALHVIENRRRMDRMGR